MPRLMFKCPYLKPGAKKNRGGFAKYIATRDGVEKLPLLTPKPRAGYVEYMARRPGAHGLFGAGDEPLNLAKVAEEISAHQGNVWTPIISLQREDAQRLCYNSAESWRVLAMEHAVDFAKAMKIQPQNFVWYGAFHQDDVHPHMHMVCYSKNPREGFLTEKGIETIKSALARDIFQNELREIYMQQTIHRDHAGNAARESLRQSLEKLQSGIRENETDAVLMAQLAEKLESHKGKMVYGYLRPPVKAIVNEIVDELAKTPLVEDAYSKWWNLRQQVAASYTDTPVERIPLSQNEPVNKKPRGK